MSLNCSNVDIFLHVSHYAACCEFTASKWLRGVRDKTSMQLQILNVNERNKGCLCLNLWIRRFVFIFLFFYCFSTHAIFCFFFPFVLFQKKNRGVIMVNLHSNFISCRNDANISNVAGEASVLSPFLIQPWSESVVFISHTSVNSFLPPGFCRPFWSHQERDWGRVDRNRWGLRRRQEVRRIHSQNTPYRPLEALS